MYGMKYHSNDPSETKNGDSTEDMHKPYSINAQGSRYSQASTLLFYNRYSINAQCSRPKGSEAEDQHLELTQA